MLRHNQILPSISGLKNNQWVSQVKVKSPVSLQGPTSSSMHFSVFMPIPSPSSSLCSILLLLSQQPDKYSLKAFMLAVFSAQYSLKQWHVLLISQFLEVVTKRVPSRSDLCWPLFGTETPNYYLSLLLFYFTFTTS